MNREIEFRGKIKDNEWIYGYYHKETSTSLALQEYGIGEIDTHYIHTVLNHLPFKVEVIGETVGQYTGLKDKNGKKIFEGDIIIAHDTKFIIKFGEYRTKLFEKKYSGAIHTKQFGWYAECIENKEQCNLVTPNDIEVIGNIYENNLESEVN